jgi:hypothetical protein
MAKLAVQAIRDLALRTVEAATGGIRYTDLIQTIAVASPETPVNTIHGSVWDLHQRYPQKVSKPSRGLFVAITLNETPPRPATAQLKESDFYPTFAEWLKNDLDEVTVAVSLGGAGLRAKWGTPDVVGVYKPLASNLIKFPIEIVSAEMKIDPQAPVVAFGQAVAYRLFSSKTYVAMPSTMTLDDQDRLEALCMLFGVGLVLFDLDLINPNFTIRVRAQRFSPDMFYVNEFAERLKDLDPDLFEKLF